MSAESAFGLNKAARLLAARVERLEQNQPAPLEPDFPFKVATFDAAFFRAESSIDFDNQPEPE